MSYSPREYVADCEHKVEQAKLIAKHYPDARHEQWGNVWVWCHVTALKNATHFSVIVCERGGEMRAMLCPYHLLEEGEVKVAVYATRWDGWCDDWDFRRHVEERPEIHAAIMTLLKGKR